MEFANDSVAPAEQEPSGVRDRDGETSKHSRWQKRERSGMPASERFGAGRSGRAGTKLFDMSRSYVAVFEREEDGGFSVYVPDLPGCASQGDTHEAAVANIREAIESYLEALAKLAQAIPDPRTSIETVQVEAA